MNKIYQIKGQMGMSFTLTVNERDLRVEFRNGYIAGEGTIVGGRFITDDLDVMAAMEETPWFKRGEIFIYAENDGTKTKILAPEKVEPVSEVKPVIKVKIPDYTPLKPVEPEVKPDDGLITSDATDYHEARTWLKTKYPNEPPVNFQGAAKVKDFAAKNGIVFPNWT